MTDRSKVLSLEKEGARLAVDQEVWENFTVMEMKPAYEALEAIDRASVVIT